MTNVAPRSAAVVYAGSASARPASARGGDRHAVPGGEHLVVGRGPHTRLTSLIQHPPRVVDLGSEIDRVEIHGGRSPRARTRVPEHVRRPVVADPVALGRGSERPRDRFADELRELGPRPREEPPLDPLGVGVLRGVEASLWVLHLPEQVLGGLGRHRSVARGAGHLPGPRIELQQLGVVVEHLLEVGHVPAFVGRVPCEAASELVVDATAGHAVERGRDHVEDAVHAAHGPPQQELERHRLRELGSAAEATPRRIEARRRPATAASASVRSRDPPVAGGAAALRDRLRDPTSLPDDLGPAFAPRFRHASQQVPERRHAVPRLGREVRARVERLALGGEERGQRPAALARHGLDGVHVDRVQIGALLAVDLDRDEVLVHERRRGLVLEGLAFHHVTPMACRVSDRQEDRLAFGDGLLDRLVAPGVPVDGVVGVLEQVGTRLAREAVRSGTRSLGHGPTSVSSGAMSTAGSIQASRAHADGSVCTLASASSS